MLPEIVSPQRKSGSKIKVSDRSQLLIEIHVSMVHCQAVGLVALYGGACTCLSVCWVECRGVHLRVCVYVSVSYITIHGKREKPQDIYRCMYVLDYCT